MDPTLDIAPRQTIGLRGFVEGLLAQFQPRARERHVTLDALVFTEEVQADTSTLQPLLATLVEGSLRRAPAGTNVTLVVSPRGPYTEFRVADEGSGMPGERGSLSDGEVPTAPQDSAPLASYRRAVEAGGGHLSVTENDEGTVVCLALPSSAGPAATDPWCVEDAGPRRRPETTGLSRSPSGIHVRANAVGPGGKGRTILVVDDEPLVPKLVVRQLHAAGYTTLTSDSAEDALQRLAQHSEISGLVSDVGLPGMSGAELVRRASRLAPHVPALLMSATARDTLVRDSTLEADTFLLQKPFAAADLLTKLQELLEPRPLANAAAASSSGQRQGSARHRRRRRRPASLRAPEAQIAPARTL
jgi:CheY-like chemotaxis protein